MAKGDRRIKEALFIVHEGARDVGSLAGALGRRRGAKRVGAQGPPANLISVAAKSVTSRPPSRRSQKKSAALTPIPIPIPTRRH